MADQISGTNEAVEDQKEVDPWITAFAALEPKSEETGETTSDVERTEVSGTPADTSGTSEQQDVSNQDETIDSSSSQNDIGGLDTDTGINDREISNAFEGVRGTSDEDIKEFEEKLNKDINDRAINDVAQEFINRGIRHRNGQLGATLDDEDICKRDSDGVPRFYNPETGREFTGDNPRRQAQEWVDDYNKELARVFNNTCAEYEQHLKQESAPRLAVMKFVPKYEKLDDIRKGMFENVIQDYEIKDEDGSVVGYSCDLDKALALVDRQIEMIQSYAKQHQPQQESKPTGPALDMKTSSGAMQTGNDVPPNSLAEAMERLQNKQLEDLKK